MAGNILYAPCPFTDREKELEALQKAYEKRPGLAIVYGRRRIGKTRLILEWLKHTRAKSVYYIAQLQSHTRNLKLMAEKTGRQLGDPLYERITPGSLGDLLDLLSRSHVDVVVIDEFTYWARSSPQVVSELQEYVDTRLPGTSMLVILTGSLVGVMERSILGGGSPLYARSTARLKLGHIGFEHLESILPRMPSRDRVIVYSLVGGIPFYLCPLAGAASAEEAVEELILNPGSMLATEKDLLLREELRDPHSYNAILSAMGRGYDTPGKIAVEAGIDQSHARKYLHVLERLGFVERRPPLFSRKGRYRISDPVIRTWYTLVEPVQELLEAGLYSEARTAIMGKLPEYVAPVWEDIVRSHLLRKHAGEGYTLPGRLEHRGEEVDIAILNTSEKKAVIAEAKWSRLTLEEAASIRRRATAKARRLLPGDYEIAYTYVACREIDVEEEWIITPDNITRQPPRKQGHT